MKPRGLCKAADLPGNSKTRSRDRAWLLAFCSTRYGKAMNRLSKLMHQLCGGCSLDCSRMLREGCLRGSTALHPPSARPGL